MSVSTAGQQGNDISGRFAGPAISGTGQVVAFDSIATTLVPGDTNNDADVFVRDRPSNTTERVSVSSAGNQGNNDSTRPVLDASGNLVAFDSNATNFVPADANASQLDIFVHNRTTDTTELVSVSSDEEQGNAGSFIPSISADGRFVSFTSDATNLIPGGSSGVRDVFVRDLVAGTTEVVSVSSTGEPANSSSGGSAISADGRWVVFSSFADNLVPGDTNQQFDVFIHDRVTGLTELVSVSSDEEQGDSQSFVPSVSADGQLVVFLSSATNLVPGDTNEVDDIFLRDRATGTTERVSVSSDEEQADGQSHPAIRGFLAAGPDITADGRFVAFYAAATNLVPGDTNTCPFVFSEPGSCPDVFVRDLLEGTTERWSVASDGTQANDRSADPVISDDGGTVAFFSAAGNLVAGDTNECPPIFLDFPGQCPDIFVHEQEPGGGGGQADLDVAKSDSQDPTTVGARLRYRVLVTNLGPAPATQVTMTDVLPPSVQFVAVTSTQGACSRDGRVVMCDLGTIEPGQFARVRIVVRPTMTGTIRNRVVVDAAEIDPVPGNNSAVESTRVR